MFLLLFVGLAYGKERIAILNANSLNKDITYEDVDFISEEIRSAIFYSVSKTKYDLMQKETITQFFRDNDMTLYRDYCCHLNNKGMFLMASEIVNQFSYLFKETLE